MRAFIRFVCVLALFVCAHTNTHATTTACVTQAQTSHYPVSVGSTYTASYSGFSMYEACAKYAQSQGYSFCVLQSTSTQCYFRSASGSCTVPSNTLTVSTWCDPQTMAYSGTPTASLGGGTVTVTTTVTSTVTYTVTNTVSGPCTTTVATGTVSVDITCDVSTTVGITHYFSLPPLNLDVAAGAALALAVIALWALAWAFRVLIRLLKEPDGPAPGDDV